MHELSLVASVFEILEDESRRHGAAKVTRVVLKVGVMSGVVPELLLSAFDMYKKGTLAETARLEIVPVPVKLRCPGCGGEAVREDADFSCAGCGSRRVEIVEGRDLFVETVDLET